jgi:hypothetical protein
LEKLKAAYLREQEAILKQQQEAVSETQEKGESREEHTGRKRKRNQVSFLLPFSRSVTLHFLLA